MPETDCRRWRSNPSGKRSQERLTRGTVISTSAKGQHVLRGVRSAVLALVVRQYHTSLSVRQIVCAREMHTWVSRLNALSSWSSASARGPISSPTGERVALMEGALLSSSSSSAHSWIWVSGFWFLVSGFWFRFRVSHF